MKHFRYLEELPIVDVDTEQCIGCKTCVAVCPHRVFTMQENKAVIVDRGGCMECGACARNCPVDAIHVNDKEGCGCAILIINSWLAKYLGRPMSNGCC